MLSIGEIKELQEGNALYFSLLLPTKLLSSFVPPHLPISVFFPLISLSCKKNHMIQGRCLLLAARIMRLNLWLYSKFATATDQETTNFSIYEVCISLTEIFLVDILPRLPNTHPPP